MQSILTLTCCQYCNSCHFDHHADTLKGYTCTYCREFVVNIISHWMLEAANVTCGDYSHNESEWDKSTLTPIPALKVRAQCVSLSIFPILLALPPYLLHHQPSGG